MGSGSRGARHAAHQARGHARVGARGVRCTGACDAAHLADARGDHGPSGAAVTCGDRGAGPLPFDGVVEVDGIPVTSPPRTLLDLASVLPRRQVERAIDQAEVLRLTDPLSLEDLVHRYPRRRGTAVIRAILDAGQIGANITREELEDRFLVFLDDQALPRPAVNAQIEAAGRIFEADCLWRAHGVIAELDGRATHATIAAFERDRVRDRVLQAAGWRVVRITWRHLHDDPAAVAADLRTLLVSRPRAR